MNSQLRVVGLLSALLMLGSCAANRGQPDGPAAIRPVQVAPVQSSEETAPQGTAVEDSVDTREEIVERGTGRFLGPSPTRAIETSEDGDVNLRFEAVSINEFVQIVLGELLGVNYTIDPNVMGTVTVQTSTPITQEEVLPLFEEILSMHDAALVRTVDFYRVVSRNAVQGVSGPLSIANGAVGPGFRTQVIPLEFIAAQDMQTILEKVVPDSEVVRIDAARNVVIASGSAAEIQTVQDTIDIFDVDWLRGMSIGLYPLDNVDPRTLENELVEVLNATAGGSGQGVLSGIVRIVPLDRLTSMLVVSSTPTALREIEVWIRRLDRPGESSGRRLYVYPIQNAKAIELAETLSAIFQSRSGGATSTSTGSARTTSTERTLLAPGLSPVEIGSGAPTATAGRTPTTTAPGATVSGGTTSSLALAEGSSIEIIADDIRNALLILASPQDYRMVEQALIKLDVVPLQVLIEASILEVTLRDDLSYGVEWFFQNSINGDENTGTGTLDLGSAGITALAPGFSYTVVDTANRVRLALNTLASESEVNVLSSPSLMVLDNQTATINVGDEIPVPTRQSISNLDPSSPTVNEISFRQTGVTLSVTPRVNSSGLVTMDIRQEVASASVTTTSNIDAPTIQNRMIESVVAINSGETIVLGGLMQDQRATSETGVPGLYKVPVLGRLFGRKANELARTELLVLITPRVVRNREDARAVTEEFRLKLPQLRSLAATETTETDEEQ